MLILSLAAFLYLVLALGLVVAIDNMVGLVFRETRSQSFRLFNFGKALSGFQRLSRK
ncbi:hypothetical protein C9413_18150 [Rhizobium sp. SEMIA 4085]|uniref:Uncharacterized protein n=1 Tax=Rhizobium gallicum bv. gallicum R602sp TaxID=1041138 RepID=A0A0B4XDZ9_9HYPH|nr:MULTISPECIES: hypothetical protein [Rhizobium]AJD44950.1 hypothetical protein RGR602_PC00917 [Rhizobium gallicum bv. gallicum R602sp]NNH31352.1 hypothetical protein [Rhizobium sp. SEMIA 4085]TDW33575.1 hypothetical protein EV128_105309 [Rhizobium azibense]